LASNPLCPPELRPGKRTQDHGRTGRSENSGLYAVNALSAEVVAVGVAIRATTPDNSRMVGKQGVTRAANC